MRLKDLTGQRFGRLVVIHREENYKDGNVRWLCKCDCGKYKTVFRSSLCSGLTKSCGCLLDERRRKSHLKHNLINHKLYKRYSCIKGRCYNTKNHKYKNYGGRGITMCAEWKNDFMNFYNWAMANGYREDLTIDRIDVNGNYEPSNCRWITILEQENNRTDNVFIEYNNKKHTIAEWGRILGIKYGTLEDRIRRGLPLQKCFYKGNLRYSDL